MARQEAAFRRRNDSRVSFAIGAWTLLVLFAVGILSWRIGRSEAASVSGILLCLGVAFAAALSLSANVVFHASDRSERRRSGLLAFVVTTLPPFIPAVAFAGEQSTWAVTFLGVLFVITFAAAWGIGEAGLPLGDARRKIISTVASLNAMSAPMDQRPVVGLDEKATNASTVAPDTAGETREVIDSPELSPLEKRLLRADPAHIGPPKPVIAQWMTRTRSNNGNERIEGSVQIEFAPRQKQAVVHLPFVPPLARLPVVDCHVVDDSGVRIKIGTAQRYGTRLEARRSESTDNPLTVEVSFTAEERIAPADAA